MNVVGDPRPGGRRREYDDVTKAPVDLLLHLALGNDEEAAAELFRRRRQGKRPKAN